jgi:transposase
MGVDRRPVSEAGLDWPPADRSTVGGGWDSLDSAGGSAMARLARGRVWAVGNHLRSVQRLERQWLVGQDFESLAGQFYRRWCDRQEAVVHRWYDRSSPSVCRWGRKKRDPEEPVDHALGRSRGGFSTKIHILCDGHGHPLHFHLTAGQEHDSTAFAAVLEGADARLQDGDGEPVAWPVALGGDKGYRADWIDEYLLERDIQPVIPSKENEDRRTRPIKFDRKAYRRRNIVERLIGWLKEARRIFARFEKTAKNFAGFVKMAFIKRYLRLATSE